MNSGGPSKTAHLCRLPGTFFCLHVYIKHPLDYSAQIKPTVVMLSVSIRIQFSSAETWLFLKMVDIGHFGKKLRGKNKLFLYSISASEFCIGVYWFVIASNGEFMHIYLLALCFHFAVSFIQRLHEHNNINPVECTPYMILYIIGKGHIV